jgi:hypothetical protein
MAAACQEGYALEVIRRRRGADDLLRENQLGYRGMVLSIDEAIGKCTCLVKGPSASDYSLYLPGSRQIDTGRCRGTEFVCWY